MFEIILGNAGCPGEWQPHCSVLDLLIFVFLFFTYVFVCMCDYVTCLHLLVKARGGHQMP